MAAPAEALAVAVGKVSTLGTSTEYSVPKLAYNCAELQTLQLG